MAEEAKESFDKMDEKFTQALAAKSEVVEKTKSKKAKKATKK